MILVACIPLVLAIVAAVHGAVEEARSHRVDARHAQILDNILAGV